MKTRISEIIWFLSTCYACQLPQQVLFFHMKDSWACDLKSQHKMIIVQICIQNYNMHFSQSNQILSELPNFGNYKIS